MASVGRRWWKEGDGARHSCYQIGNIHTTNRVKLPHSEMDSTHSRTPVTRFGRSRVQRTISAQICNCSVTSFARMKRWDMCSRSLKQSVRGPVAHLPPPGTEGLGSRARGSRRAATGRSGCGEHDAGLRLACAAATSESTGRLAALIGWQRHARSTVALAHLWKRGHRRPTPVPDDWRDTYGLCAGHSRTAQTPRGSHPMRQLGCFRTCTRRHLSLPP